MRLLILDTATEAMSVALYDGSEVVAHHFSVIGRGHAERILPTIRQVLADAGWTIGTLTGIAVGRGPGAFTGVRIGVSVAQGLAFALDIPTTGVSDLHAVGLGAGRRAADMGIDADAIVVALDARMGEVYAALCILKPDALELQWESLCAPSDLPRRIGQIGKVILAGHGFVGHPEMAQYFPTAVAEFFDQLPDALDMAGVAAARFRSGQGRPSTELEPVYLRDDVASRANR